MMRAEHRKTTPRSEIPITSQEARYALHVGVDKIMLLQNLEYNEKHACMLHLFVKSM